MLLPDNIDPKLSIYYIGAFALQELQKNPIYKMVDLYYFMKVKHNITFSVFILCLDWLYLIGAAKSNNKGEIELCS